MPRPDPVLIEVAQSSVTSGLETKRRQLIALNSARNLSRDSICRLALRLDDWVSAEGSPAAMAAHLEVNPNDLIRARRQVAAADSVASDELQNASESGMTVLTSADRGYPETLRQLALPPPVLYCKGALTDQPAVAIVGSRKASPQGREIAECFSHVLASCGLLIVSGFARGIDLAAHRGALAAADGRTLAILGCGLDVDYPRRRQDIREEIARRGSLVSEFPLGARPAPLNFPIRNRIIAALAIGTLVIQGTPRSGSLITARLALDLGRDVYAVPGTILDPLSAGPNGLIRDGALLIQEPRDILESLPVGVRAQLDLPPESDSRPTPTGLPGMLMRHLRPGQTASAEALARKSGLPLHQVHALLLELELSGFLKRLPGALFLRRL